MEKNTITTQDFINATKRGSLGDEQIRDEIDDVLDTLYSNYPEKYHELSKLVKRRNAMHKTEEDYLLSEILIEVAERQAEEVRYLSEDCSFHLKEISEKRAKIKNKSQEIAQLKQEVYLAHVKSLVFGLIGMLGFCFCIQK